MFHFQCIIISTIRSMINGSYM